MSDLLRNRSGMALVLTLLAVSFLVAVTVQLGSSVNWQMRAAANQRDVLQLDALLLSGLNLARASLLSDQQENEHDSFYDSWGTFEPNTLAALLGGNSLEIQVVDLSGRLQVNALALTEAEKKRQQEEETGGRNNDDGKTGEGAKAKKDPEQLQRKFWKRFLSSGNFAVEDQTQAQELIDTAVDWLDENDEEEDNGAEQGYYSTQDPPYSPANGPIIIAEELLLVKGWNRDLLYGENESSGIIEYLTIAGRDGKININTAPAQVLQALHTDMTEELAGDLIAFREDDKNKEELAKADWYKSVSGFPGDITFDADLVTTASSYFLVTVTARVAELMRTGSGVLHRMENQEQEMLYWKVE